MRAAFAVVDKVDEGFVGGLVGNHRAKQTFLHRFVDDKLAHIAVCDVLVDDTSVLLAQQHKLGKGYRFVGVGQARRKGHAYVVVQRNNRLHFGILHGAIQAEAHHAVSVLKQA